MDVLELIRLNGERSAVSATWSDETRGSSGSARSAWIEYGLFLGALSHQDHDSLERIIDDDPTDTRRLCAIFRARKIEFIEGSEDRAVVVVGAILDRELLAVNRRREAESVIEQLAQSVEASRYALASIHRGGYSLSDFWEGTRRFSRLDSTVSAKAHSGVLKKCGHVVEIAAREASRPSLVWASEISPWENLVEGLRAEFGEPWAGLHLANVAAGISSSKETCTAFADLLDHSRSLCRRVRYARLRAGQAKWWEKQLDAASDDFDAALTCLVIVTWGGANVLVDLAERIDGALAGLSDSLWTKLYRTARSTVDLDVERRRSRKAALSMASVMGDLSPRFIVSLGIRADDTLRQALYRQFLKDYDGHDASICGFCQVEAASLLHCDSAEWRSYLKAIGHSYAKGYVAEDYRSIYDIPHTLSRMPLQAARQITEEAEKYPGYLIASAEGVCRAELAAKIVPVGAIARRDDWFP